jgi:hypothetical protein
VVERGGLENRCTASSYRGFESLPLRCNDEGRPPGRPSSFWQAGPAGYAADAAAFLAFFFTLPLPLAPMTRNAPRMKGWMRQK